MTRSGPPPPPGRLAAVLGAPPGPADAPLGPDGVWPPPRSAAHRTRSDPPTVPLPLPLPLPVGPGRHGRELGGAGPADARGSVVPRGDDRAGGGDVGFAAEPARRLPAGRLAALLGRLAPPAWRGARVDPGRPGAAALALVAAAAAVLAAVGVWFERPRAEPVADLPAVTVVAEPTAAPEGPVPPPADGAPATLVVSVSGKVQRPGLVEVPEGSRVADVLEAAGGALPGTDLSGLNLARRVGDGEQVAVGVPPAPDAAPAGGAAPGPAAPGAPAGKIDLNSATLDQLDALPGVGPVTAQRILEWRTRNGRFTRIEQLREIEGIGERRFAQLRELVSV